MRNLFIPRFRKRLLRLIDYIMDTDLEILAQKHGKSLYNLILIISVVSIAYSITGINNSLKDINKDVLTIHTKSDTN